MSLGAVSGGAADASSFRWLRGLEGARHRRLSRTVYFPGG